MQVWSKSASLAETDHLELPKELDSKQTLITVFGSRDVAERSKVLRNLHESFPQSLTIGCSTAGEIFQTDVADNSVSIAIARFDKTKLSLASTRIAQLEETYQAGVELAKKLQGDRLKGGFILSDGLQVNGSELVRGMNSVLPKDVIITGGLAGDGIHFKKTWVVSNGQAHSGWVSAVGFYGDSIRIGHGSQGGWDIFGPERKITRSKANVLFELDNKPALDLYKQYLGARASGLPATGLLFPLSIRSEGTSEKRVVRTILAVNEKDRSLTFAGDVPEGFHAQLMKATFDRLIDGAVGAINMVDANRSDGTPTLCIAISCVGRRMVLGERIEEETEAVYESLPKGAHQIGFYSYGEISPFVKGAACDLHNQTMTITVFQEV